MGLSREPSRVRDGGVSPAWYGDVAGEARVVVEAFDDSPGSARCVCSTLLVGVVFAPMRALDVLAGTVDALPGNSDAQQWIELLADLTNDLGRPVTLPQPSSDLARSADRSVLAKACRRVRAAGRAPWTSPRYWSFSGAMERPPVPWRAASCGRTADRLRATRSPRHSPPSLAGERGAWSAGRERVPPAEMPSEGFIDRGTFSGTCGLDDGLYDVGGQA